MLVYKSSRGNSSDAQIKKLVTKKSHQANETLMRVHSQIEIQGIVQGVGFRPFIARLATCFSQNGWVKNTSTGVLISIEGLEIQQQKFLNALQTELPPFAEIFDLKIATLPLANFETFEIVPSVENSQISAFSLPDIAICPECVADIFNPQSRYFRYPFTSCCSCGTRYSIATRQPFDRENTSMAEFKLCKDCTREYQLMDNRRFHAQTLGCEKCGVQLSFWDEFGNVLAEKDTALKFAVEQLKAGKIVAVKGIGGFQLLVDATNQDAVKCLRERKKRPMKPFALMVQNLAQAQMLCKISKLEQAALISPAAPIVLLKKLSQTEIVEAVAPQQKLLGVMLAYSPLHHLFLHDFGLPIVATSGNRSNEPICIDNDQALVNLSDIADYFLMHNRKILRPLDDSIVREINGKITMLRRARGFAPLPIKLKNVVSNTFAVGGQMKNTVAMSHENQAVLSQHLGDLDSLATRRQFEKTLIDLQNSYAFQPVQVMHDLHPDYVSSQFAANLHVEKIAVQHHYAHALSCMTENGLEPPVLGIVWDGTGLGLDGTIWGGEFLNIYETGFERFAHFRMFSLVGGSKAIQEPRRVALSLLFEIFGDVAFEMMDFGFSETENSLLKVALSKNLNSPKTSSVGRLFDGVASLLELCHVNQYEGHAAMLLENFASECETIDFYDFEIREQIVDWQPMIEQLLQDKKTQSVNYCAAKFHNTLAKICVEIANHAKQQNIVLSGGCFQNALLTKKVFDELTAANFVVHTHQNVPPNDGGLALGQLYAAYFQH
ncbi:MAG: carbamoyltransferase HypF [Methylococcales bacterium]|nr:carbamoyltransferase HypF [Methylococcales bacterium]